MDVKLLTSIVWDWGVRCFGQEHMTDHKVRALRAAEEMIELNQVIGVDKEKLHLLIDTVYSRPVGNTEQEIGGIMVTMLVLCKSLRHGWVYRTHLDGHDIQRCTENEILRCLSKSPEHFAKRNLEKIQLGLK